jgi:hypothetical protein
MGIINNQGVFIAPPLGPGDATTLTSFREDDDFSTEIFDESIVLPSLPNNVGIAFIKSSDSPADFATISLNGIILLLFLLIILQVLLIFQSVEA